MSHIELTVKDHIATVTYNRPPVNAVSRSDHADIRDMFWSFRDRADVRVVIFTSSGDRTFMAGADLRKMDENGVAGQEAISSIVDPGVIGREAHFAVYDCPVPVIAAVNARAVGTAVAYIAVCDIIISAEGVTFSMPEVKRGLLGGSAYLDMLLPRHKVRELFFTGEEISAEDLERLGSVRRVVPRADLLGEAESLARSLIDNTSPIALRLLKESCNRAEFRGLKEGYLIEQGYTAKLQTFDDSKEARLAFLEKRSPVWTSQ